MISKTVHPIHFEDYSWTQFERLVFAYHLRVGWTDLIWHGQCGGDDGRDIGGNAPLGDGQFRPTIIQCVNRESLTLHKATQDMKKAVAASREPLTSFKFVCRCNVSSHRRKEIEEAAVSLGIVHVPIWSGAEFEELLRRDTQSLLMRFVDGVEFPDEEGALRLFVEGVSVADRPTPAERLADYRQAFAHLYDPVAADFIPISCHIGNQPITSFEVSSQVIVGKQRTLLRGPSGCGKSMLATQIGLAFLANNGVAILLQAKDVSGSLDEALDREVRLLGASSCAALLAAARSERCPTLLILDGYNECAGTDKLALTRSLARLTSNQGSCLLVTSQVSIERGDLLNLSEISVQEPDATQKRAIAALALGTELPLALQPLLESVSNGLESRLVGELGRDLVPTASRYALFDAYARKRLGAFAVQGVHILAQTADRLFERVSFSMSLRDFDRLLAAENISLPKQQALDAANLLVRRGDRVSFRHELFLNAFAAEGVIRRARDDAEQILRALALPRYEDARTLLLGAIDDERLLTRVLLGIADPRVLFACQRGECGSMARTWLTERIPWAIARIREEINQIGFKVGVGWDGAGVDPDTVFTWSPSESALLAVVTAALWQGNHLDELMGIAAALDRRLQEGFDQLRGHPGLREGISLRSALFADAYVFSSSDSSGIARITSAKHQGTGALLRAFERAEPTDEFYAWLNREDLTNGQLYLLITLCLQMKVPKESYGKVLPRWLQGWKRYPYHLRLDLLHLTYCCGGVAEPERHALIEKLKEMLETGNLGPVFNGSVMEALERLGGLEDEQQAHVVEVWDQIRRALSAPENPESWTQAAYLYGCRFDHPLSGAYWEAFEEVQDPDRRTLLWMAAKGWSDLVSFVPILLLDLAKYPDLQCLEAVGRWTQLPAVNSPLQQDSIETFVIAHILLGRFDYPLPDSNSAPPTEAGEGLRACGRLFYWMSRSSGISDVQRNDAYRSAWTILSRHDRGVGLSCLYLCDLFIRRGALRDLRELGPLPSLTAGFPEDSVSVCREALRRPDTQTGYFLHFVHDRTEVFQFAIEVLSQYGRPSDANLLKAWIDDRYLGRSAISAIKKLEDTTRNATVGTPSGSTAMPRPLYD